MVRYALKTALMSAPFSQICDINARKLHLTASRHSGKCSIMKSKTVPIINFNQNHFLTSALVIGK